MKKYLLLLSFTTFNVSAFELNTSVGIGPQYGGIIGSQISIIENDVKYYLSAGFLGISSGVQFALGENTKHSLGLNFGASFLWGDEGYLFATYDYHINGFENDGWVMGLGVGNAFGSKGENEIASDIKNEDVAVSFNIGYKF